MRKRFPADKGDGTVGAVADDDDDPPDACPTPADNPLEPETTGGTSLAFDIGQTILFHSFMVPVSAIYKPTEHCVCCVCADL